MTIGTALTEHFARVWETYRAAINDIPEEHWRAGEVDYLIPARLVYHVLEAAEFYARGTPKGFDWSGNQRRFGVDWEGAKKTIQAAIDAASSGDVINVGAGAYREWLRLKDGITLLGEGAETTKIGYNGPHNIIHADQVQGGEVSGFTIA